MTFFSILLLTAMVAITIEKCQAKYLLIQTDSQPRKGKFYLFCHILDANLIDLLNLRKRNHGSYANNFVSSSYQKEISTRSLLEFTQIMNKVLKPMCPLLSITSLTNHGCFCGKNSDWPPKSNKTMDTLDELCLEHDWCYHNADESCWLLDPYYVVFRYSFKEETVNPPGSSKSYIRATVRII